MRTLKHGYSSLLGKLMQVIIPKLTDKQCVKPERKADYVITNTTTARLAYVFNFEPDKLEEILRRLKLNNGTIEAAVNTKELTGMAINDRIQSEITVRHILNKDEYIIYSVISLLKTKSTDDKKLWKITNLIEADYNTNQHEPYGIHI